MHLFCASEADNLSMRKESFERLRRAELYGRFVLANVFYVLVMAGACFPVFVPSPCVCLCLSACGCV